MDPEVSSRDGGLVVELVADNVDPKTKLIDQRVREGMSFSDTTEPAVERNVEREILITS